MDASKPDTRQRRGERGNQTGGGKGKMMDIDNAYLLPMLLASSMQGSLHLVVQKKSLTVTLF